MSFVYSPTRALVPRLPGFCPSINLSEMWIGQGVDQNRLVFRAGTQWRMVDLGTTTSAGTGASNVLPSIVIDGNTLSPVFRDCGTYLYFQSSSAAMWFVDGFGWVYMSGGAPGYVPSEFTDENGNPAGDSFYVVSVPSSFSESATGTVTPRGKLLGGSTKTATLSWKRWDGPTGATPFGTYVAAGSSSGTRVVGCPQWKDGNGKTYIRSLAKISDAWQYGEIRYEAGKWVIGAIGNSQGWYEGSEPSLTLSVTFRFCVPEGSTVTGEDLVIAFDTYVEGSNTAEVHLGEVAIWHS